MMITNQNTFNVSAGQSAAPVKIGPVGNSTLGANTEFNPDDWIIESFDMDRDGYYCPTTSNFDYWSIWSKATFPPDVNRISIKALVKHRYGPKYPPTITISYGEYKPNFSPTQFYRLNIFDTDNMTVRLYDNKNKSVAQAWLDEEPDLSTEMSIILSPRNPNPNLRVINLNPSLEYIVPNNPEPVKFTPKDKFEVTLPTVGLEDGTVKKQVGIGGSKFTCFKPIRVDIK